jgi:hypothetical protein
VVRLRTGGARLQDQLLAADKAGQWSEALALYEQVNLPGLVLPAPSIGLHSPLCNSKVILRPYVRASFSPSKPGVSNLFAPVKTFIWAVGAGAAGCHSWDTVLSETCPFGPPEMSSSHGSRQEHAG